MAINTHSACETSLQVSIMLHLALNSFSIYPLFGIPQILLVLHTDKTKVTVKFIIDCQTLKDSTTGHLIVVIEVHACSQTLFLICQCMGVTLMCAVKNS